MKLLANGKCRYPHLELLFLKEPVRRFIGWDSAVKIIDGKERVVFTQKQTPDTVTFHQDYVIAVREGDLLAGDQETADLCGVPFNTL